MSELPVPQGGLEPGEPDMPTVSAEWVHSQRAERLGILERRLEECHRERKALEWALARAFQERDEARKVARQLYDGAYDGADAAEDHPWLKPEAEDE